MNVLEELSQLLKEKGLVMGTAESCTGGRISNLITSMAGSSEYFKGGIVSYCNDVKSQVLGVSDADLKRFGAVSKPVVEQMAEGAARLLKCDCTVATSGIAGPGGAVPGKPVGTVWISATFQGKTVSSCYHFSGDRTGNIESSAHTALQMLLSLIKEKYKK